MGDLAHVVSLVAGPRKDSHNGTSDPAEQMTITFDAKGKLTLPPTPEPADTAGLREWLNVVFALDQAHPIIGASHEGVAGPDGHITLRRLDAPALRFDPASKMNAPARLIECLNWRMIPSDGKVPALNAGHCRDISYVVRVLCGASATLNEDDETAAIIAAFLQSAQGVEGLTTYAEHGRQRYEAAQALQRELGVHGEEVGTARYLIDSNTGEIAIRVSDLRDVARRHVGSIARGWLDARMDGLGWSRIRLDGHALPGRDGRFGPHARADLYRGHMPSDEPFIADEAVTT